MSRTRELRGESAFGSTLTVAHRGRRHHGLKDASDANARPAGGRGLRRNLLHRRFGHRGCPPAMARSRRSSACGADAIAAARHDAPCGEGARRLARGLGVVQRYAEVCETVLHPVGCGSLSGVTCRRRLGVHLFERGAGPAQLVKSGSDTARAAWTRRLTSAMRSSVQIALIAPRHGISAGHRMQWRPHRSALAGGARYDQRCLSSVVRSRSARPGRRFGVRSLG